MKTSYREQDYAFGEKMRTLRTGIGLTQAGLANKLGVSRRAVGDWEAGNSYPKVQHLKELIALGIKSRAFTAEHEAEEIRALWKAACRKVPIDERWLSSLLEHSCSPHLYLVSKAGGESMENRLVDEQERRDSAGFLSEDKPRLVPTASGPRVHWGDALAIPTFYGREQEMAQLIQWIVQDRCRVVSVLGMGGIGKSALAVSTMYQLAVGTRRDSGLPLSACLCPFEVIIFHSLRDTPLCETLLNDCLQVLSPRSLSTVPANLEQRLSLLLSHLRTQRVLLVLDNLECLLQEGDVRGRFRPGFEGYGQLLRRVAETAHQSCLLITSREKPENLRSLEGKSSPVRSLRLSGLDIAACKQLFAEKEVVGTEADQERLIDLYGGNPLALKIVAETVIDLFGGEIGAFLAEEALLFGNVTDLLEEHFVRLSALEQSVLCWLSIAREPVTLDELLALLVSPLPRSQVLEAVDSLRRRSLIEPEKRTGFFTLQSVVLEYMTAHLVAVGSREIKLGRLHRLIEHGLSQARAKEYVRQTQERLLLSPLLANLQIPTGQGQALPLRQAPPPRRADGEGQEPPPMLPVEEQLLSLLEGLRELTDSAQGYGPANLIALLRLLRGHLSGLDLSRLSIRGAYLQGVEMQDANLSGATLRDTSLTEAFDNIWAVAISHSGEYWAAGSRRGEVRVWRKGIQALVLAWQAHTDTIENALAFSPNERLLATGSWDGSLKLWELPTGALLWMGQHTNIVHSVAFAPDGLTLASSGIGGVIMFWEVTSGQRLQTMLLNAEAVYTLAWSPDGHLLACGMSDGTIQLWQMQEGQPTTSLRVLTGHTGWVTGLTFAPDSTRLVSCCNLDPTVRLWDVTRGELHQTLCGQTREELRCIAWSPDGHTIAWAGIGQTIWLWDVTQNHSRAVFPVSPTLFRFLVFTPDSRRLLSSSDDGLLRIWDVTSGQCIHSVQGYAVSFYNLAWSPTGRTLASVGSDRLLTLWETAGMAQPRTFQGHTQIGLGVAWSPDGQLLVSSGMDNAIRIWNPATGACLQVLRDLDFDATVFCDLAWHPDGRRLASGTYMRGIHVWDMQTRTLLWIGWEQRTLIYRVAWSPDGKQLVSCGDDGSICLWEASSGTLLARLQGHTRAVQGVAWSPDGTQLVSGGGRGQGEVFIWEVASRQVIQAWRNLPEEVSVVAWSSHPNIVISGGSEGNLHWWEVGSGLCLATCQAHSGRVRALRVSPDERLLASSGDESVIQIWNIQTAKLLQTLRRDRPYERLTITGIKGISEAQKNMLRALGAYEEGAPFSDTRDNLS